MRAQFRWTAQYWRQSVEISGWKKEKRTNHYFECRSQDVNFTNLAFELGVVFNQHIQCDFVIRPYSANTLSFFKVQNYSSSENTTVFKESHLVCQDKQKSTSDTTQANAN